MTPSAQLAEIRERIAQLPTEARGAVNFIATDMRDLARGTYGRLALALVSAEMAAEEMK